MLNNYDVDMLLFTYLDDPNIIKSINKKCYNIYMDNYYWYLWINKVNNKIKIPVKYKYCYKIFYFKINTHEKFIKYVCKHKNQNIHLAYKYLCKNNTYDGKVIIEYLKYHLDMHSRANKQGIVYHTTKIFKCFLLHSDFLVRYDALIINLRDKCLSFPDQLDKNNDKHIKLLNIIEQLKIVYKF